MHNAQGEQKMAENPQSTDLMPVCLDIEVIHCTELSFCYGKSN